MLERRLRARGKGKNVISAGGAGTFGVCGEGSLVLATMGAAGSKTQRLEKALGTTFPESEHFYGLENFGNTCYANSVLQALYYCVPMREHCIAYAAQCEAAGTTEDDLLSSLCDLFVSISNQRRRCGVHAPRRFIAKLRNENELFNNQMHQVRRGPRHRARAAAACVHSHGARAHAHPRTHARTHAVLCLPGRSRVPQLPAERVCRAAGEAREEGHRPGCGPGRQ